MQQRRGLKQDLPKPLRPGEIGFATDSRQIYIGADTTDPVSDVYNKTGIFEKTASSQSITQSFADVQIIKFTVPHKIYDKGEFDGVTDSISWTPGSNVASSSSSTDYSRLNEVFRNLDTEYKNIFTGEVFASSDLAVVKEGVTLSPSTTAQIASGNDYYFLQSGNLSVDTHSHQLTFRTPPSGSEAVSISYYGNTQVKSALTDTTIGTTSVAGFYTDKNINSYRQLSNENIRVAAGSGIGFIGLQFKHIQVATDVKEAPLPATATNLGNLYLTRNDTKDSNVSSTYNGSNLITLTGNITTGSYNTSGVYNHVFVEDASDWLDGKVLAVNSYDSANATMVAVLPSNAASLTREITGIANNIATGNVQITVTSTENIEIGDSIYFAEPGATPTGANVSGLVGKEGSVTSINPVIIALPFTEVVDANVSNSNVSAIVFRGGSNTDIVINSVDHGIPTGNTVQIAETSGGLDGTYPATVGSGANTFVVTFSTPITANVNNLTFTPVVANATVSVTPVLTVDLSSSTDLAAAKTAVNELNLWPRLNSIPGESNKLYITHAESVVKNPFDFRLHNDTARTLSTLGLKNGEYSRANATVKAKLEEWIDSVRDNPSLNLFKEVYVNTEFQSSPSFSNWDTKIESAIREMNFESRTEAKDFTAILNNLYFESVNPDIRGLLNIKTNIEFLTSEALAAGTATTSFTAPEQLILGTGTSLINELSLNLTDAYQTMFVEYSIHGGSGSDRYRRVGTLTYTGDIDIGDAVLNDNYSELTSGSVTGNVVFSASVNSSNVLEVSVDQTISPASDLTMRYIVRRWGDS